MSSAHQFFSSGQVLKRINGEIEARRRAGEDLPPAPKTAIAGPEYFGFNQPEVRAEGLVQPRVMAWSRSTRKPVGADYILIMLCASKTLQQVCTRVLGFISAPLAGLGTPLGTCASPHRVDCFYVRAAPSLGH